MCVELPSNRGRFTVCSSLPRMKCGLFSQQFHCSISSDLSLTGKSNASYVRVKDNVCVLDVPTLPPGPK